MNIFYIYSGKSQEHGDCEKDPPIKTQHKVSGVYSNFI